MYFSIIFIVCFISLIIYRNKKIEADKQRDFEKMMIKTNKLREQIAEEMVLIRDLSSLTEEHKHEVKTIFFLLEEHDLDLDQMRRIEEMVQELKTKINS